MRGGKLRYRFLLAVSTFVFLPAGASAVPENDTRGLIHRESPAKYRDWIYSSEAFQSATRHPVRTRSVAANITVITRAEIDTWPVSDLDETLRFVNGMVIQDNGLMGQTATAQLNGSRSREVRVLIDGITMNPTTTGGIADLSQIPIDIVEKIEIIKGPASSSWGSAMGGVINIITRPAGDTLVPHGSLLSSWGEHGIHRDRGEVWGSAGPLHYFGAGSYGETEGFRPTGDELEKRGFLKQELELTDELSFDGLFGYAGSKISEFEVPGSVGKRKLNTRYGKAGFSHRSGKWENEFYYKISDRTFDRDIFLLPAGTFFQHAKARSLIHEASVSSALHVDENQTFVAGADIGVDGYHDAVFRATTTPSNINKHETRQGYYGNYQLSWKRLDLMTGSRIDVSNSYGASFNPSAGAVLNLPHEVRLRGNVARGFNAPSLVDRYLTTGTLIANPDLAPETVISYQLGLDADPAEWVYAKGMFFQSFHDDSVDTLVRSDGLRQPVNISEERRTGVETELRLGPWYGFTPSYETTFVRAVDGAGIPLQSRPRFTQDVKLKYHGSSRGFDLDAVLAGKYVDLVTYAGFSNPDDQVFLFDSKVSVTFPRVVYGRLQIFVIGKNLFNEDFSFDPQRSPNPKSYYEAGFKIIV